MIEQASENSTVSIRYENVTSRCFRQRIHHQNLREEQSHAFRIFGTQPRAWHWAALHMYEAWRGHWMRNVTGRPSISTRRATWVSDKTASAVLLFLFTLIFFHSPYSSQRSRSSDHPSDLAFAQSPEKLVSFIPLGLAPRKERGERFAARAIEQYTERRGSGREKWAPQRRPHILPRPPPSRTKSRRLAPARGQTSTSTMSGHARGEDIHHITLGHGV